MAALLLRKIRVKRFIRSVTRKFGVEISRYEVKDLRGKIVSLKPDVPSKGNALLSYRLKAFFLKKGEPFPNDHITAWESLQIANILLELGYAVDVIYYEDGEFIPRKEYSLFIDVLTNLERIAPLLNKDCIKIFHILWPHWLFYNTAEFQRLLALQQRKGISLKPRRQLPWNSAIEYADCATMVGNDFTAGTYSYANKPIFRVPNVTTSVYPWQETKNFDTCRRNFLWLGGSGAVIKGLDLVLETFAEMPDFHLTVCGLVGEPEFEKAYHKELYQSPNIRTHRWIDTASTEFTAITKNCVGLIYPSAGEGQSGAVLTCLHAGLIPVISYESGVDVNDFGIILKDCSIEEIRQSIQAISDLPAENLRRMSRRAWECVREEYTKERFVEGYKKAIVTILDLRGKPKPAKGIISSFKMGGETAVFGSQIR